MVYIVFNWNEVIDIWFKCGFPVKTDLVHQNLAAHQLQLQPNLDISMQGFNWGWGLQYSRKMFKFFFVANFIIVHISREYLYYERGRKNRCFTTFNFHSPYSVNKKGHSKQSLLAPDEIGTIVIAIHFLQKRYGNLWFFRRQLVPLAKTVSWRFYCPQ